MPEEKLTLRDGDGAVVRMYGQGFGDCFLLAFPRVRAGEEPDRANPVYVVIDSGVFYQTPGDRERMRAVAGSIHAVTGGTIDLLAATHEHHDHLCGFEYAKEEWKKIGVRRVWLAWTEDENHPATREYDREHEALQFQAELALWVASTYREQDPALAEGLRRVEALLEFRGDGDEAEAVGIPPPEGEAAGVLGADELPAPSEREILPPDRVSKTPDRVLDDLAKEPGKRFNADAAATERDFCEPGQVRTVPETAVDAYVLGPPTARGRLAQDIVETEIYHAEDGAEGEGGHLALAALAQRLELAAASERAERESLAAALERRLPAVEGGGPLADAGAPFPGTMNLPYEAARRHPFFRQRYFEDRDDRTIETEWLRGFGRLALQVDRVINNTSLVLAFRLPDERVLLFVGDAQVGNWLSWHEIRPEDWRRPDGGTVEHRPTARELLARTEVYKVGHHGSHNATLKARGLEMMADGLIAFVPTSRVFPQEQNDWDIPLGTLVEALWRKSGGRVVFPHEDTEHSYAGTEFGERVESSAEVFAPMVRGGETLEEGVPLWRQVRL